jgi:hypothetical protein
MLAHSADNDWIHAKVVTYLPNGVARSADALSKLPKQVIDFDRFTLTNLDHPSMTTSASFSILRNRVARPEVSCGLNSKPTGDLVWIKGVSIEAEIETNSRKSLGRHR